MLPRDIAVRELAAAPDEFHARYSAIARYYRYVILNRPMKSALLVPIISGTRAWRPAS